MYVCMYADYLQHTEKQTYQELSFVLYLELEITMATPTHKRRKSFRCVTNKEQYFLCTRHASELAEDDLHSSVTDIFGKLLPILYCGRYHAISVWSRKSVPRHTPLYTAVKREKLFNGVVSHSVLKLKAAYFKAKSSPVKHVSTHF